MNCEIFFPSSEHVLNQRAFVLSRAQSVSALCCGIVAENVWSITFSQNKPRYVLHYYEPGKRPNTERQAKLGVHSVQEAVEFMNAHKETAFLPASVQTRSWRPQVVAILG